MKISDTIKIVTGCAPAALTSTAGDGDIIDLRSVNQAAVVVTVKNGTSVTAGNVQLLQGNVNGGNLKVLDFNSYFKNDDTDASDTLIKTTANDNCFLTLTTNSKKLKYVIDVPLSNLDAANGFCTLRVDVDSMANAVGSVDYLLDTNYPPLTTDIVV